MNYPPGTGTPDLPGIYSRTREEDTIEAPAYCEVCEWEGLAEIFEGIWDACPNCNADGLVRA